MIRDAGPFLVEYCVGVVGHRLQELLLFWSQVGYLGSQIRVVYLGGVDLLSAVVDRVQSTRRLPSTTTRYCLFGSVSAT